MNNNNLVYDNISGYEFGIDNDGDMFVVVNGQSIKLVDNQNILNNMIKEVN